MGKKILSYCFPYLVSYYLLMLIAYTVGVSDKVLALIAPTWSFIPSMTIPYDLIGWFWTAVASVYCGGAALLNFFTSRNLHDLSNVELSMEKLAKISYMNYFACFYCLVIKIVGVDIPLEAIVSSAGACTVMVVVGKKAAQTGVQLSPHEDLDQNGVRDTEEHTEEEIEELRQRYEEKAKTLDEVNDRLSHSKCLMYGQLTPEQENALVQLMIAVKSGRNLDIQVRGGQILSRLQPSQPENKTKLN
jgi:hypothetical protein